MADIRAVPSSIVDHVKLKHPVGAAAKRYVRSASGVVACATAGLGVAVASIWMCAEELASGELTEVLTDYASDPIVAFVVFPAGRRPSQKARVFADYLEQAVARPRTSPIIRAAGSG